jgi:hypothetical protein
VLSVAGFYQQPFRPVAEKTIEIEPEDNDEILRGRIDILVLNERLWVTPKGLHLTGIWGYRRP